MRINATCVSLLVRNLCAHMQVALIAALCCVVSDLVSAGGDRRCVCCCIPLQLPVILVLTNAPCGVVFLKSFNQMAQVLHLHTWQLPLAVTCVGSVFPSGTGANTTLTLEQLALCGDGSVVGSCSYVEVLVS